MRHRLILSVLLLALSQGSSAQMKAALNPTETPAESPIEIPSATSQRNSAPTKQARISLSPRFIPGQTFRYEMEFETTTATSRSGFAKDPQGPSKLVVTWDAAIRLDVLPAEAKGTGALRVRITYEKSAANIQSDTFDPEAAKIQDQYQKLEGKVVEFTLDADGKVISVSGLEGFAEGEKALESAREWIAQLAAGPGTPPGGVIIGQKWSSDHVATSLPVAGLVWRSESEYLRDEPCHSANPGSQSVNPAPAGSASNAASGEICAVVQTQMDLLRPKPVRDPTPEEFSKNGVLTKGTWDGSGRTLSYISLRTGLAVSVTQTGTQAMDVTLTTGRNDSLRYAGTILTRSQVTQVASELPSQ